MRKLIPFTKGFTTCASGIIHDAEGNVKTQYTNGDGYKTVSVLMENGRWVTFGVQRLVALAFKPPEGDHLALTVNHIDGNITNNHESNLEFVSTLENNSHGTLLNRFTKRPLILCCKEGEEMWVNDLADLAERFNTDIDTAWKYVKTGAPLKGWVIRHVRYNDKVIGRLKTLRPGETTSRVRSLKMLDLDTKETKTFSSMGAAAKEFGTIIPSIRSGVSTPGFPKLFRGRYVLVDDCADFSFLTPALVEKMKNYGGKSLLTFNLKTKEFDKYPSAYNFIKLNNGISKKAVTTRLKKGSLSPVDGWIIKRLSDIEKDKEKILEMARSLNLL